MKVRRLPWEVYHYIFQIPGQLHMDRWTYRFCVRNVNGIHMVMRISDKGAGFVKISVQFKKEVGACSEINSDSSCTSASTPRRRRTESCAAQAMTIRSIGALLRPVRLVDWCVQYCDLQNSRGTTANPNHHILRDLPGCDVCRLQYFLTGTYIGCMKSGPVLADKNLKYHEPESWKFGEDGNTYFRHATGQIYAISKDLATCISINQPILQKYENEDVSLGSWFIGLEVNHIDERNM